MAGGSWLPWWPKSWNPFSRWKYSSAYDYDTILASLAEEIELVELTLMDIKARKRRAVSRVLQVLLMLWVGALAVLWGYASLAYTDEDYAWARSMFLLGLIVGTPVLLVVFHRLISLWFRRLEKAQETHLQALRKQRREKINEIKKATDFEHLRLLLERYDDETSVPEPSYTHADGAEHTSDAQSLRSKHSISSLRREPSRDSLRPGRPAEARHSRKPSEKGAPKLAPAITGMPIMGVPSAPPARGWMDKFADVILGTDPYGASLEDQQYALICRNCFRHNGLVPKNELNEIQYVCPHCNTFNSRRPSSKPVSSPFAGTSSFAAPPKEADEGEGERERPAGASPSMPASATSLPWAPKPTDEEPAGIRRSARLRSATREYDSDERDESMQVDDNA